jgi:transposase
VSTGLARRRWSRDEKGLILEEARAPGASVSEVARRHGVNANLLFKWLRMAARRIPQEVPKAAAVEARAPSATEFVALGVFSRDEETGGAAVNLPVVPAAKAPKQASRSPMPMTPKLEERAGVIEIDLADGTRIRVDAFVNQGALRRVLQAVKGQS